MNIPLTGAGDHSSLVQILWGASARAAAQLAGQALVADWVLGWCSDGIWNRRQPDCPPFRSQWHQALADGTRWKPAIFQPQPPLGSATKPDQPIGCATALGSPVPGARIFKLGQSPPLTTASKPTVFRGFDSITRRSLPLQLGGRKRAWRAGCGCRIAVTAGNRNLPEEQRGFRSAARSGTTVRPTGGFGEPGEALTVKRA